MAYSGVTAFGATRCLAPYPKNVRANTVSAATMALLWFLPKSAFIEAICDNAIFFSWRSRRMLCAAIQSTANLMQVAAAGSAVSKRLTCGAAVCAVGRLVDVVWVERHYRSWWWHCTAAAARIL